MIFNLINLSIIKLQFLGLKNSSEGDRITTFAKYFSESARVKWKKKRKFVPPLIIPNTHETLYCRKT